MCWFQRKLPLDDDDLYPMIRGHEITLNLARSAGLASLLSDLGLKPELRDQMRQDSQRFLADRRIDLPQGATLEVRELEANGWEIEVRVQEGLYVYINGFNNEKGFYRVQGPQRPPKRPADDVKTYGA
jgi:hypothetical protein